MKVDFGTYSKQEASDLLFNKVNLSQNIAKKFLDNIPSTVPNYPVKRHDFEILVEGFLVFIIAARDGLSQEINSKLNIPLNERKINICSEDFKNKLTSDPNPKFKQIWKLIENAIQQPERVVPTQNNGFPEWDRRRSWLWEINELRNRIVHRGISNQAITRHVSESAKNESRMAKLTSVFKQRQEPSSLNNTELIITMLATGPVIRHNQTSHNVPIPNPNKMPIKENNPRLYFNDCYEKLKIDVRNLLQP